MAGATAWAPASHLQVLTSGFLCQRPGSSGAGRPPRSPRSQPGTRRCLMRLMASVRCPLGAGWKERKGAPAQRTDTSLVQGTPPSGHPPLWQEERGGTAGPQCSPSRRARAWQQANGPPSGTQKQDALPLEPNPPLCSPACPWDPGSGPAQQGGSGLGWGRLSGDLAAGWGSPSPDTGPRDDHHPASAWLQGTFAGELGPRLGW